MIFRDSESSDASDASVGSVIDYLARVLEIRAQPPAAPVEIDTLRAPMAAINVGLEAFHSSLEAQGAGSLHVDWRPPARGNPKLQSILERMR